jgi:hypothetical protein
MERNQSNTERLILVAVGLIILSLGFIGPGTVWALVGAIPLLLGMVGYYPFYRLAAIHTPHKWLSLRSARPRAR